MVLGQTIWRCEYCGHEHRSNREQCVRCGYVAMEAVESGIGSLGRTLTAALPALLVGILMGLMAAVLFF